MYLQLADGSKVEKIGIIIGLKSAKYKYISKKYIYISQIHIHITNTYVNINCSRIFIQIKYAVTLITTLSINGFDENRNKRGFIMLTYFHFA